MLLFILLQNPSRDFQKIHRQSQRNNNPTEDGYWAGHPRSSDGSGLHNCNPADQSCENTQASGKRESIAPLTIFIMLPQFLLMGIADSFVEVGKLEFFFNQAPESMQSIGTAMFSSTMGIGNFVSSFLLTVVTKITGRKGHNTTTRDFGQSQCISYLLLLWLVSCS